MREFEYDQPAVRVIFGVGALEALPDEIRRMNARRAFVVTSPGRDGRAADAARNLGDLAAGVYPKAIMHVPIESALAARQAARRLNADCCVAIGGGSTIGLAKAIALESGLPILAIPTTYAGSEMTSIYGITEGGTKRTGRDPKVRPKTVIYDPQLTLSLPPAVAGPSGLNALAHCVEALYAHDANPVTSMMATEGIRVLARALPEVVCTPSNVDARAEALYGAWLAGAALSGTSMSIHHKLCHTLGGAFGLPHAELHAVVLPYSVAFNRHAAPGAMQIAAASLGVEDAAAGIYDLNLRLSVPMSLKDIGMPGDGLDRAARLATENPYRNPRPIDYDSVRELLEHAYHGARPA